MAVWLLAYAQNNLGQYDESLSELYLQKVQNTRFNFEAVSQELDFAINKMIDSEWIIESKSYGCILKKAASKVYLEADKNMSRTEDISVYVSNDFLQITGPFNLFSVATKFTHLNDKKVINAYLDYFGQIAQQFDSTEIVYFSEWFADIEEIDGYGDVAQIIESNQQERVSEIYGMSFQQFYVQKL